MTGDRDNGESASSMVWPTLGSKTAEEQNRTPDTVSVLSVSLNHSFRMTEDKDKWRKYVVHGVANPRVEDG